MASTCIGASVLKEVGWSDLGPPSPWSPSTGPCARQYPQNPPGTECWATSYPCPFSLWHGPFSPNSLLWLSKSSIPLWTFCGILLLSQDRVDVRLEGFKPHSVFIVRFYSSHAAGCSPAVSLTQGHAASPLVAVQLVMLPSCLETVLSLLGVNFELSNILSFSFTSRPGISYRYCRAALAEPIGSL